MIRHNIFLVHVWYTSISFLYHLYTKFFLVTVSVILSAYPLMLTRFHHQFFFKINLFINIFYLLKSMRSVKLFVFPKSALFFKIASQHNSTYFPSSVHKEWLKWNPLLYDSCLGLVIKVESSSFLSLRDLIT